jgi:hypothetical protein
MLLLILNLLIAPVFSQMIDGQDNSEDTTQTNSSGNQQTTTPNAKVAPSNVYSNRKQNLDIRRLQYGRYNTNAIPTYLNGAIFQGNSNGGHDVQFHDGSTQDTAASLSGSNYYTSASTINVTGYNNWEIIVASGDFSKVTAATATIPTSYWGSTSSTTYHVHYEFRNVLASSTRLMFNNDATSTNYNTGTYGLRWSGAAFGGNNSNSFCFASTPDNTTDINTTTIGDFRFTTKYGGPSTTIIAYQMNMWTDGDAGLNGSTINNYCKYAGSSLPAQINFNSTVVNSITGHWEIWQAQYHQP